MSLREAAADFIAYCDEMLAGGNCPGCGGHNDDGTHDEGTLCAVLKAALNVSGEELPEVLARVRDMLAEHKALGDIAVTAGGGDKAKGAAHTGKHVLDRFDEIVAASCTPGEVAPLLAEEINALPDRARAYIHDLETRADPAGDVMRMHALSENNAMLALKVQELQSRAPEEVDWNKARDAAFAVLNAVGFEGVEFCTNCGHEPGKHIPDKCPECGQKGVMSTYYGDPETRLREHDLAELIVIAFRGEHEDG